MKVLTSIGRALGAAVMALPMMLLGAPANAQINSPLPSGAYISYAGLEWAWGGPCPYSGGCYATGDLSYQSTVGWRLPSAAEMGIVDALDGDVYQGGSAGAFAALFLNNPAGNVPANGTDPVSGAYFSAGNASIGSCATPYFSAAATWCDSADGLSGLWAGSTIAANSGYESYGEQLYVRSAVPEASTWAMMLLGFAGLAYAGHRSARKGVAFAA